ncbi:metallophosphoesterase family protein [Sphingomonas sp.]
MFPRLLSRLSKPAVPAVPPGRRIYAIGDIHGRLDLLDGLLARIADDESARGNPSGELIFLGDLIDRGPQSAQVIDRLIALKAERPSTRFLLGNHEEVFLSALEGDNKVMRFFDRIGGAETILSYGISREEYEAADYAELGVMFRQKVPAGHRAFLGSFENMIVEGDYVFVHAGIRPGVSLDQQKNSDLRWIREDFLDRRRGAPLPGKTVVYGHTIGREVDMRPGSIGIDTGAYCFGVLTAMGFEGEERWILQERDGQGCPTP